jgi:FkbM family methyltransferase
VTFVSYAQTYEDVILARAFAGITDGFYIDVGAQDPRFDSVTKAFYDMGWRGINLEPVEHWHRKLVAERPRDINLCLAAGDHEGTIEFHETDESGLSTASAEFAARHRAEGHALRTRRVPVSTLDAICRAHDVRDVHFLKVDVEGAEAEVLRGLDLDRLRPWVILVEATEPNSRVSTHARWEHLVTDHGYRLVYQDGLNRFYLAREHEALAPAFADPPNIFDDFVRREQVDLGAMLEARIAEVDAARQALGARLEDEHALSLRRLAESEERAATIARVSGELEAERALSLRRLAESEERAAALARMAGELDAERDALARTRQALQDLRGQAEALAHRAENAEQRAAHAEDAVASLSRDMVDLRAELRATFDALGRALEAHAATLAELARAQADFESVIGSRSWRLTAPLRRAMTALGGLRARVVRRVRRWAATPLGGSVLRGLERWHPALAERLRGPVPDPMASFEDGELVARAPGEPEPLPLTRDALLILQRCPVRTDGATREAG